MAEPARLGSAAGALPVDGSGGEVLDRELPEEPLVEQDLLVEEVSIDGMCGVY
jgi:mycofactocin precursor